MTASGHSRCAHHRGYHAVRMDSLTGLTTGIWRRTNLFRDSQQGYNYGNYEALQSAVRQQLQRKEKNLHWADTHSLVQRWKVNVDRDGDYNRNRCTFNSVVAKFYEISTCKTYSIIIIIIICVWIPCIKETVMIIITVIKLLLLLLLLLLKLDNKRRYDHVPQSVESNNEGKVTVLWNQQVRTDRIIPNYRPYIIMRDNERRICMILDVAISGDRNVIKKESEEILK